MHEGTQSTQMFINKAAKTRRRQRSPTATAIVNLRNRSNIEESLLFSAGCDCSGGRDEREQDGRTTEGGVCVVGKEPTVRRFENSSNGAAPK